jgi:hypothetical protein
VAIVDCKAAQQHSLLFGNNNSNQYMKIRKSTWRIIYRALTIILPAIVFQIPLQAQNEIISNIKKAFDQYRLQALVEKLYVHTDKTFYVAGEIMWFKIYDVDGTYNKPLRLSKVAYVEVIDKDQKPVMQAKIGLDSARGNGSFFIPLSIRSGNYRLRAYTSWMKNFSADYFFEKNITVINALRKLDEKQATNNPLYDIHFFPEGGNLVNGIESRVGFRIVDQSGRGVEFEGNIIDQNNANILSFKPHKFGMGQFRFTPQAGNKYSAVIKVGTNNAVVVDLPAAYAQGYVMHVEEASEGQLRVNVKTSTPDQFAYLFVHTRQVMKHAEMKTFANGSVDFMINKSSLGDGITCLTVFNYGEQAVCERLYFRRPADLQIEAGTDRNEYGARNKVTVNMRAQEPGGKSVKADMSMSVYLVDSLQSSSRNDILSYLWLRSDLRGNIESPEYYFENPEADVAEDMDNLLLTQGWRRFIWSDILQGKLPAVEFLPEYEGHLINGKVTNKISGLPAENIVTYLSSPGQRFAFGSAISNKNGLVHFNIKDLMGNNQIVVQTADQKDSINRIDIFTPFADKYSETPIPAFNLPTWLQADLLRESIGSQVQNAYLKEKLQRFGLIETTDSTAFFGTPDKKYFLDDYTRFNTMEEVMREYVGDVTVHKRQQKFYFRVLNEPHQYFFEEEPLMLMDGVVFHDADKIMSYDPLKLKKIEVVGRQYFYGGMIANGIISYTTYKGDLDGFQIDPSAVALDYEGLQLKREFYSPIYESPNQLAGRNPDFRNLLYWTPEIKTDEQGFSRTSFYSSDMKGRFLVVIEGLTQSGLAGSKVISFDVK